MAVMRPYDASGALGRGVHLCGARVRMRFLIKAQPDSIGLKSYE